MSARVVTMAAVAAGIALSAGMPAASLMSKPEYQAARKGIAASARFAKAACTPLGAGAKGVCLQEAGDRKKVALAQLEDSYRPSDRTRLRVVAANAQAARTTAMTP
jgi:hypothetical protein